MNPIYLQSDQRERTSDPLQDLLTHLLWSSYLQQKVWKNRLVVSFLLIGCLILAKNCAQNSRNWSFDLFFCVCSKWLNWSCNLFLLFQNGQNLSCDLFLLFQNGHNWSCMLSIFFFSIFPIVDRMVIKVSSTDLFYRSDCRQIR